MQATQSDSAKTELVLELHRITKSYPGVVALDGVNLAVYRNEIVGLVGENGAGKSTLMKILIGVVQPDQGAYRIRGEPVRLKDPGHAIRLGVGMVFQEGSLIPNLSIMENLFLCHETEFEKFGLLSKRAMRDAAEAALAPVKVFGDLDLSIAETTPAVRQMVEIARLLWLSRLYRQKNPVLILDEPTTVLTEHERETLFSILHEIRNQASIILISHRLQEIVENPDTGSVTIDQKRLATGSPSEAVRSGIGQIPIDRRSDGLALGMTVAENVSLLVLDRLKTAGLVNPIQEKKNALQWIKECRIKTPSSSTLCANLSGGNQQKTVIAKWLTSQVRFLVLDHPTRGADVGAKDEIYRLIRQLATDD